MVQHAELEARVPVLPSSRCSRRLVAGALTLLLGLTGAGVAQTPKLELPRARKQEKPAAPAKRGKSGAVTRPAAVIAITAKGEVGYGGRRIGISGVGPLVRRLLASGDDRFVFQVESSAHSGLLVKAIDEARKAGARNVSIATRPVGARPPEERRPATGGMKWPELPSGPQWPNWKKPPAPPTPPTEKTPAVREPEQRARVIKRVSPMMSATLRRRAPATVTVVLVVDERGAVERAKVQSSTDSAFDAPTLRAVRRWKFVPAKRGGKPTKSVVRLPIRFRSERRPGSPVSVTRPCREGVRSRRVQCDGGVPAASSPMSRGSLFEVSLRGDNEDAEAAAQDVRAVARL